jgi:hypothetical protein
MILLVTPKFDHRWYQRLHVSHDKKEAIPISERARHRSTMDTNTIIPSKRLNTFNYFKLAIGYTTAIFANETNKESLMRCTFNRRRTHISIFLCPNQKAPR